MTLHKVWRCPTPAVEADCEYGQWRAHAPLPHPHLTSNFASSSSNSLFRHPVLQVGVASTGINLYRRRQLVSSFDWAEIKHVHFDKKKFILVTKGKTGSSATQSFHLQTRDLAKVNCTTRGSCPDAQTQATDCARTC